MRSTTKTFVASVGMGICAISYAIGANSASGTSFSAGALNTGAVNTDTGAPSSNSASPSTSDAASQSSSSTPSPSSTSSGKTTAAGNDTKTKSTKSTGSGSGTTTGTSSTPAPQPSSSSSSTPTPKPSTSTPPPTSSSKVTKTGALFNENRWGGQVQVTVTKTNGKVTAVDFAVATATGGRDQAFPYLQQLAVASNGKAVANVGGATFTTNVFNQALASAMSKF